MEEATVTRNPAEIPFSHSISVDSNNSQTSHTKLCRDHYHHQGEDRGGAVMHPYPNTGRSRTPCMTRTILVVTCIVLILLLLVSTILFMYFWTELRMIKEDMEELRKQKHSACLCPTPSTGQGHRENDNVDNSTPKFDPPPLIITPNSTYDLEDKLKQIARAEILAAKLHNGDSKQKTSFAHMGGSGGTVGNNDQFDHFHSWDIESGVDNHFSNQRVRISKHKRCFHVNSTGWYYIYNQVYLQKRNDRISNETVSHEIVRKRNVGNNQYEIKQLMFSVSPAFCDQTKYNGGIFHIKDGDFICLKLNNQLKINAHPGYSFFGLFMLAMDP